MTHRNAPLTVLGRQRAVTEVLGMGFVGLALTFLGGFALLIWISGVDILFSRDLLVVLLMAAAVLSLGIFAWAIFEVRRGVFAVTTEGLVVTPHLRRSRFVPWAHVSRLEISDAPMAAGSVVVVTTTKTCITASRTTGPSTYQNSNSAIPASARTGLAIPFNAAQDALERYRRGESA